MLNQISSPAVTSNYDFDGRGFLKSLTHTKGSTVINKLSYASDEINNVIEKQTSFSGYGLKNSDRMFYDDDNQLIGYEHSELNYTESYSYDELGNRIADHTGSYSYDSKSQRLKSDHKYFYTYDHAGNLSSKIERANLGNTTHYFHNAENRLYKIETYKNNTKTKTVSYLYSVSGQRIVKQMTDHLNPEKSYTRKYQYQGDEILAELDEDNTKLAVFTHSTFSIGEDITINPSIKTSYGYTNRELDAESGLMYYRARYYMPEIGRFIEEDPHPGFLREPLSLNSKYIYVENSPLKNIDPYGLFANMAGAFENTVNRFFKDVSREATRFWKVNKTDIIATTVVAAAIGLSIASGGAANGALISGGISGGLSMAFSGSYSFSTFIRGAAGGIIGYASFMGGVGALGQYGTLASALGGTVGSAIGTQASSILLAGRAASPESTFIAGLLGGVGGALMSVSGSLIPSAKKALGTTRVS